MIPKIVHYCWISGDPFPEKIQKCIDSWKRVLPEYEIVVWDYAKVHNLNVRWCEEAMTVKKYAFVADYIRFYALYNYGGIYLDSDVEVLKSFDKLLKLKYFVGQENSCYEWEAAILGAEKGTEWIGKCLEYYKNRRFINIFGELQTHVLPSIINNIVRRNYKVKDVDSIDDWSAENGIVCRFPLDWFSPKEHGTMKINCTGNTYCIHHFTNSWQGICCVALPLTWYQKVLYKFKTFVRKIKSLL